MISGSTTDYLENEKAQLALLQKFTSPLVISYAVHIMHQSLHAVGGGGCAILLKSTKFTKMLIDLFASLFDKRHLLAQMRRG